MPHPLRSARWLFLDVGYTLSDESAGWEWRYRTLAEVLVARGRPCTAEGVRSAMRRTVFERDPQIWAGTICRIAGPEQVDTLVAETEWPKHLERPFPDADEVLTRLASRYKVGVIANQSAGTWDRLQACGWGRLLSVCISSTEENLKKPDPRIYQLALDRAGCAAADAVMIGDRLDNDVRPAKSLGMGTVRIRQGLFAEIRPRDDAETPDAEVDSLTGLIDLFGV